MTYNIEDVRTRDLKRTDHPRLRRAAARIQALSPDILLINELTYDQPGAPGYTPGDPVGSNARRFVENYLSVPQADTLTGRSYQTVMLPVNTGQPSGYDLNNDGRVVTTVPTVPSSPDDGSVAEQTAAGRAYGGDAWGFGTFPGQYGMAVFVDDDLTVLRDSIRTFRHFRWAAMPHAAEPLDSTSGEPWFTPEEWRHVRLSSKSHWDVPVRLPDGAVVHVLASHPTPPAFDGPARRNERRNHDEIRFWVDYLDGAAYIEDDSSREGGLHENAAFVVMGDLNADPDDSGRFREAIRDLVGHDRVNDVVPTAAPTAQSGFSSLDPDDTARWGKRVDYVLPSITLTVDTSGVWRPDSSDVSGLPVSDHFPVWMDVRVPPSN
ncbi:MAG TPA: endonuclease/exonuclease/phosphatase family protein [Salinibacter sp.]|nr:endonuclease/exonuclease/phosphatase family protein [Salinibacter sp.]